MAIRIRIAAIQTKSRVIRWPTNAAAACGDCDSGMMKACWSRQMSQPTTPPINSTLAIALPSSARLCMETSFARPDAGLRRLKSGIRGSVLNSHPPIARGANRAAKNSTARTGRAGMKPCHANWPALSSAMAGSNALARVSVNAPRK